MPAIIDLPQSLYFMRLDTLSGSGGCDKSWEIFFYKNANPSKNDVFRQMEESMEEIYKHYP